MQKKRKILLVILIIILIALAVIMSLSAKPASQTSGTNYAKNKYTIYNQGGNVLEYGDYTFFVDNNSKSIFRYDNKNFSTMQIIKSNNSFYEKLFIINNNLIFSTNGITYYISLEDNSDNQYKKFVNGQIEYITEDLYIYVKEDNSANYLYISSYNSETFRGTNEMFYTLAQGYNIEFLKQIDDELYFTSTNSDDSVSLFEVDLKNYQTTLVVREFLEDNEVNTYLEFEDVEKTDSVYYYVLSRNELTTATLPNTRYYLYNRNIEYPYKEFSDQDVVPYLYKNSENSDDILYQSYTEYSVEPVWNVEVTNWKEFVYGDVTRFFSIDNSKLILDGEILVDLAQDFSEYEVKYALRMNDKYYILLSNDAGLYSWYSCSENGDNLSKILTQK